MRELFIRNKADTNDGESNRNHFRNIYYNRVGHSNYFKELGETGAGTPYKRKVIQLHRKL